MREMPFYSLGIKAGILGHSMTEMKAPLALLYYKSAEGVKFFVFQKTKLSSAEKYREDSGGSLQRKQYCMYNIF